MNSLSKFHIFCLSVTPAERRRRASWESSGALEGSQGQRQVGGTLHPQSAGGNGGSLREAPYGPTASAAAAPDAATAATEPELSTEPHVVGEALHCFKGEGRGKHRWVVCFFCGIHKKKREKVVTSASCSLRCRDIKNVSTLAPSSRDESLMKNIWIQHESSIYSTPKCAERCAV